MPKSNAQLCRESRQRRKDREQALDLQTLALPFPAGTRAALDELMQRHGHDDPCEAVATMIHRLHEAGPALSACFLEMSRHEFRMTEEQSRQLEAFAVDATKRRTAGNLERA